MIEISMLLRTFLRSGMAVLQKESPSFRAGWMSNELSEYLFFLWVL